jgi:pSer/pThr/pTyr-binding forkhead associated (FHA) protein
MAYVFCNRCGHRNPPTSGFCSACGSVLDLVSDRTISLTKVDPLLDAPGTEDDILVDLNEITPGQGILVVRSGDRVGEQFVLSKATTTIGRHPESDIILDDITVSRRHVQIDHAHGSYTVTDAGSLNGTYINQQRVDSAQLYQGDELQVGKYRFAFLEHAKDVR